MSTKLVTRWTLSALAVGLVMVAGATVNAQDDQQQGRIVQIGPDDNQRAVPVIPPPANSDQVQQPVLPGFPEAAQPAVPQYWIGLMGGSVTPELRAHVDIPEDQGLLVREVVPNSPAAKAGLKMYDILLRANDTQLTDMRELVDLVRAEGERQGQLTLEVLRKGNREAIWVQPEERPAQVAAQAPEAFGGGGFHGAPADHPMFRDIPELGDLFQGFQGFGDAPFEFRQFGPGVIVGGRQFALENMPNGVSISVERQNDQPPKITVKRGDESWQIVGDDPESLAQLPDDLRPFVERMLQGNGPAGFQFNAGDLNADGDAEWFHRDMPNLSEPMLRQRLEAVERRLQELMQQWNAGVDRPSTEPAK